MEITICDRLDRLKYSSALPRVFTEQGVAMLSSVLRGERAIQVDSFADRVKFIAPVKVYPGEQEMLALAAGALKVLAGTEAIKHYSLSE